MARRSHGCSYTASVDPVDTELITNVVAANNIVQTLLKNQISSARHKVEIPYFSFVSSSWPPLLAKRARTIASNVVGGVTYLNKNSHIARIRTRPYFNERVNFDCVVLQCLIWVTCEESYLEDYGLQTFTGGS